MKKVTCSKGLSNTLFRVKKADNIDHKGVLETTSIVRFNSSKSTFSPDQQEEIEEAALALLRIFQNLRPFLR